VVWLDHDSSSNRRAARPLLALADRVVPFPVPCPTQSAEVGDGIGEEAERMVSRLAEAAGRPGAGLAPRQPVTVLTCLRNEQGHIDPVVGGVVPQLGPDDEYLIVDDGSTDGTPAEIARWLAVDARLRTLRGPAVNAAAARNVGIGAARHPVVACIDAGCVPAEGWLDALRAPFSESSPPSLLVGVYHVSTRTPRERAFAAACFPDPAEARHPSMLVRVYGRFLGRAFNADRLDGRSMAVRRDAWRAAGGFREDVPSLEDAAFSRDVIESRGRTVLALDADVEWEQHPTLRATARMYAKYGVGDVRTGDRQLVARDLARAVAYLGGPVLALVGGKGGRLAASIGSAAYLSLPLIRAARSGDPRVIALVPLALAVKDLAKCGGCIHGLLAR
jgi:glycosyltransferase involved in cell wall biosynthesis